MQRRKTQVKHLKRIQYFPTFVLPPVGRGHLRETKTRKRTSPGNKNQVFVSRRCPLPTGQQKPKVLSVFVFCLAQSMGDV